MYESTYLYKSWKTSNEEENKTKYSKNPLKTLFETIWLKPEAIRDIFNDEYTNFTTLLFFLLAGLMICSSVFVITTVAIVENLFLICITGVICCLLTKNAVGCFRAMIAVLPWMVTINIVAKSLFYMNVPVLPIILYVLQYFYVIGVLWIVLRDQKVFDKNESLSLRLVLTVASLLVSFAFTFVFLSFFSFIFVGVILIWVCLFWSVFAK